MKVLLVSSEFPPAPGGLGRHAADFSLALVNYGYTVDVYSNIDFATDEQIKDFRRNLDAGINLYRFERTGWWTYFNRIILVLSAVRRQKYERLIFTGKFPLWIGAIIKSLYGTNKKVEFIIHGSEVNPGDMINRILTHWALQKPDKIWSVSKFTKSLLPSRVIREREVNILPNGIHVLKWQDIKEVSAFGNWEGSPKLLTVGKVSPRKGHHRVINALPELIKVYPQVHYHIVGMNENCGYLYKIINELHLENHVTFHGILPEAESLAKAYRTADVFLMLSENQADGDVEGFGIAILEANLFGVAAIGARGCGIEDAILPGINGELVDGDKPVELLAAVNKILYNREAYKINMQSWVIQHNWNSIIKDFINAV